MKRTIMCLSILLGVLAAGEAHARSVYLNGFDISEIRNQTFEKVKVVIDKDGNIRIDGPQYDVKVVPPAEELLNDRGGPNALLKNKYYLVTQPPKTAGVQYDFLVTVNGKARRRVKADGPQLILEISAWLKKGENNITVAATKNIDGIRKSFSAEDKASILVGMGHEEGKIVKIDAVKVDLRVNGSETDNKEEHFRITVE
jgi:hypothetical protein